MRCRLQFHSNLQTVAHNEAWYVVIADSGVVPHISLSAFSAWADTKQPRISMYQPERYKPVFRFGSAVNASQRFRRPNQTTFHFVWMRGLKEGFLFFSSSFENSTCHRRGKNVRTLVYLSRPIMQISAANYVNAKVQEHVGKRSMLPPSFEM